VRPTLNVDDPSLHHRYFKAAFAEIEFENVLIVIILPFSVPDNMLLHALKEARVSLEQLVDGGLSDA